MTIAYLLDTDWVIHHLNGHAAARSKYDLTLLTNNRRHFGRIAGLHIEFTLTALPCAVMAVISFLQMAASRTPQAYVGQSPQGPARVICRPYILMGPWIASVSGASGTLPSAGVLAITITAKCAIPAIAIATRVSGSNGLCSPRGYGRDQQQINKMFYE